MIQCSSPSDFKRRAGGDGFHETVEDMTRRTVWVPLCLWSRLIDRSSWKLLVSLSIHGSMLSNGGGQADRRLTLAGGRKGFSVTVLYRSAELEHGGGIYSNRKRKVEGTRYKARSRGRSSPDTVAF